jgi:glutaredoxin
MKIKILTIEGCDKCAKLKAFLKETGLQYSEIPCESNSKECDTAERMTSCDNYPIVILENDHSNKKEYVYQETTYERLRPIYLISENITLIPTYSIDGVISWIRNKLN